MRLLALCALLLIWPASSLLAQSNGPAPNTVQATGNKQFQKGQPNRPVEPKPLGSYEAPLVVKLLPSIKSGAEVQQDREERARKDANDRTNLLLTKITAFILFMQLAVFGYQGWQLRKTIKTMRSIAESQTRDTNAAIAEANRSAKAMEEVARGMTDSVANGARMIEIQREFWQRQMRAYLAVVVHGAIFQEREKGLRFQGMPIVVNTGQTPAYRVRYRAAADILPVPLPDTVDLPLLGDFIGSATLGPHHNFTISAKVDDYIADREVARIKRGDGKALYIWGIVTYEDAFANSWETNFFQCITWLPDGTVWGVYPAQHNTAT